MLRPAAVLSPAALLLRARVGLMPANMERNLLNFGFAIKIWYNQMTNK